MKRWNDPFPHTPEGFHARVEQTLCGLEERESMNTYRYKRIAVIAIAALIAILAATAVAAVVGNSRLKDVLKEEGLNEVADMVQELHLGASEAEDGFAFTIDEMVWEDSNLFITYSIAVPEDGNYLVALHVPRLNGSPLDNYSTGFNVARFYENDRTLLVFGGKYERSCTDLLTFHVDPALKERSDNALGFRAELLKTDLSFEANTDFGVFLNPPYITSLNTDDLWFETAASPEHKALLERLKADGALTLDKLVECGYAERVTEREINMAMDTAALPQTVYNDVEKHDFDVKGVHLHVNAFRMTHMGISMEYTISVPGYKGEDARAIQHLNDFGEIDDGWWGFGAIDGSPLYTVFLGGSGGGGWDPLEDGTPAYTNSENVTALIPLEGMRQIIYAPMTFPEDEQGNQLTQVYDMENAVVLTPTFNPAIADAEARESAERAAIAAQYDGDPDELVYATENGIWYHTLPHCTGMMNAKAQSVGQAVANGKRPCPRCAEGDPADLSEPVPGESDFSGNVSQYEDDISN